MHQEWKTGLLHKFPKKGDLSKCKNWRGKTHMFTPNKVFAREILTLVKDFVKERIQKEQVEFR